MFSVESKMKMEKQQFNRMGKKKKKSTQFFSLSNLISLKSVEDATLMHQKYTRKFPVH